MPRKNPSETKVGKWVIVVTRVPIDREGYTKGKYPQYYGAGGQPVWRWELYNDENVREFEQGEMRAASSVDVRRWVKKHHAYLFAPQQNPSLVTPLKSLIGKTLKIVKQGGKIVGIPVGRGGR